MKVYEVLARGCDKRNISYAEIARRCAMNADVVSRIMHGKAQANTIQLLRICKVLGLTTADFQQCDELMPPYVCSGKR